MSEIYGNSRSNRFKYAELIQEPSCLLSAPNLLISNLLCHAKAKYETKLQGTLLKTPITAGKIKVLLAAEKFLPLNKTGL
jgi:hypothetical protein